MPLKRYITKARSGRTEIDTIVKLPEDQAAALGLEEYEKTPPKGRRRRAASTKSRSTQNKAAPKPNDKAAPKSKDEAPSSSTEEAAAPTEPGEGSTD